MNKTLKGTTSPILNKVFEVNESEQQKLGLLDGQLKLMNDDFELMKRAREQSKKQLQARFQDVQRKIANAKDFILSQGKRINNTLVAFQMKLEGDMTQLKTDITNQYKGFKDEFDQKHNEAMNNLKSLDQRLQDQKRQRIKQASETGKQFRDKIDKLFQMAQTQKNTRLDRQKFILSKLSDQSFKLNQELAKERAQRQKRHKELKDHTEYELKSLQKFSQDFFRKSKQEFDHVATHLQGQMNQRLGQQNQMIENISKVVKTLQDTLKIIGKSV